MEHSYNCHVPRTGDVCNINCDCNCHKQRAFACSSTYGPTFYLLANVQGIMDADHAKRVAEGLLLTDDEVIVEETWL